MTRDIFHKVVSKKDPDVLCDALRLLTGISNVKIKDAMAKGAAWIRRSEGKRRRVRRAKTSIRPGDEIWLYFDPDILSLRPPEARCMLDRNDYSIWYKPAGLMSQGSNFGDHCALPRLVETHFSPRRPVFPVHRLDRETAGLIIVAHGKNAAARLSEMLRKNRIQKQYRARVKGDLRSVTPKKSASPWKAARQLPPLTFSPTIMPATSVPQRSKFRPGGFIKSAAISTSSATR